MEFELPIEETGRPVVTSNLPAVKPWGKYVEIASSQAEFVQTTLRYLRKFEPNSPKIHDLHQQLKSEIWKQKSRLFEDMLAI